MTRKQFIDKATREYERRLGIPAGWWGRYGDITDGVRRVHITASMTWTLSLRGRVISRHDSRTGAINKARRTK